MFAGVSTRSLVPSGSRKPFNGLRYVTPLAAGPSSPSPGVIRQRGRKAKINAGLAVGSGLEWTHQSSDDSLHDWPARCTPDQGQAAVLIEHTRRPSVERATHLVPFVGAEGEHVPVAVSAKQPPVAHIRNRYCTVRDRFSHASAEDASQVPAPSTVTATQRSQHHTTGAAPVAFHHALTKSSSS